MKVMPTMSLILAGFRIGIIPVMSLVSDFHVISARFITPVNVWPDGRPIIREAEVSAPRGVKR